MSAPPNNNNNALTRRQTHFVRALNRNTKPLPYLQLLSMNLGTSSQPGGAEGHLAKVYKLFSVQHVMGEAHAHTQHPWGSFLGGAFTGQETTVERGAEWVLLHPRVYGCLSLAFNLVRSPNLIC